MRPLILSLALAVAALGQDRFEVAAVRVAAPRSASDSVRPGRSGGPGTESPLRVSWRSMPLGSLLLQAFGVPLLFLDAPNWAINGAGPSTLYDITASVPEGTTREQFDTMVRNLLVDRFGMKFHSEQRERTAYKLIPAKNGSKPHASSDAAGRPFASFAPLPEGGQRLTVRNSTMAGIARFLGETYFARERAIVTDATGWTENFDFEVSFAPRELGIADGGLPTLATALEQDLGLRLERTTAMVNVIVVDRIESVPSEN